MNVGFIGTGNLFALHLLGYKNQTAAKICAISDHQMDKIKEELDSLELESSIHTYFDYKQMLDAEELDIIEILDPSESRLALIRYALDAGVKGISICNPIAHSLEEADEIIKMCKDHNIHLSIYENHLFAPHIWKAKKLIEDDYIGDIASIRIKVVVGKKYYSQKNNISLFQEHSWGVFSLAYWLFNEEIEKVFAWADVHNSNINSMPLFLKWKCKTKEEHIIPKYGNMEFCYLPEADIPSHYYPRDEFIEIIGSRGLMKINQLTSIGNAMTSSPMFSPLIIVRDGKVEPFNNFQKDLKYSFIYATNYFLEAYINKRHPILSSTQARDIFLFHLAVGKSLESGKDVYLEELQ